MAESGLPTKLASIHHSRSRSLSPSKLPSTRPYLHFGSSCDQLGFEDVVLAPPVALTSDPSVETNPSQAEQNSTSQQSRPPPRTLRQSFLETCRHPPLITRSSGGGISRQAQPLTLSLPTPSFGKKDTGKKDTGKKDTGSQAPSPPSPAKERWAFMPTFTGDKAGLIRVEDKGGRLADWFSGSSEPVNLGLLPSPTKEKVDSTMDGPSTNSAALHPYRLHRKTTSESALKLSLPNASRFSFFGSKLPAPEPQPESIANDELISLDITSALFPGGPADPFSPSSFRNLLTNAEGLLRRLQTAYKQRIISLHEITSENNAHREELEEAQTRARHLQLQLDDMAAKVAEGDEVVKVLTEELASERQQRRDEEKARKRSIILVSKPHRQPQHFDETDERALPVRQLKRESNGTIANDSGFESEDDSSSAESVFSRTRGAASPTTTISSASGVTSPEPFQSTQLFASVASTPQIPNLRPALGPQRASTFQKILKGLSTSSTTGPTGGQDGTDGVQWGCANCQGGHAAEAWSVVGVLRDENQGLKARVGELEGAVEGCLGIVGGL